MRSPRLIAKELSEWAGSLSRAIRDIAAERSRQIEGEGWTPEHDGEHAEGEMALAAAAYASASTWTDHMRDGPPPVLWPWAAEWWKPKDRRRDLVRAGALIAAEIERLDRAAAEKVARWGRNAGATPAAE